MARKKKGGAAKFKQACLRAIARGKNNGFTRACSKRYGKG
jgi:hypothetical protein